MQKIILKIRQQLGLSQAQLGKNLGLHQSTIAKYETGRRVPHLPILFLIIRYCKKNNVDVDIDDLISRLAKNK